MDDEVKIPFIAFESTTSRQERTIKRLWILCIILVLMLVGANAAWIYYESQWETTETVVTQDVDSGNGGNAVISDGVHINGTCETDSKD